MEKDHKKMLEKNSECGMKIISTEMSRFLSPDFQDLACVVNSYIYFRLPCILGTWLYPLYSKFPNWMLTTMLFLPLFTQQASNLATTLMLLNRLSAVATPLAHTRVNIPIFIEIKFLNLPKNIF